MQRHTIAVIGHGSFGRLAAAALAEHAEVVAHDRHPIDDAPRGVAPVSLADACRAGAIVLAVNAQHLEGVLREIAPNLRPGVLVADVASVKAQPVELMTRLLPRDAQILATHPLFGPQSVAELGLPGQRLAVCPVRIDPPTLDAARELLAGRLGLELIDTTPDEHDRQMALVQALTHLVGHAAAQLDLADLPLGTLAYRRLCVDAVQAVRRRAGDAV